MNAHTIESSENAGRDPCLFSKRTAIDGHTLKIDHRKRHLIIRRIMEIPMAVVVVVRMSRIISIMD
jgi:hypothetical protein